MFTVYVLKSKVADKSYVGVTNNLQRRLEEHNSGKGHAYTARYCPWEVIHKEYFKRNLTAREREKYLKSRSGRRYLAKIFSNLSRL